MVVSRRFSCATVSFVVGLPMMKVLGLVYSHRVVVPLGIFASTVRGVGVWGDLCESV
jgi:hypothetical protein